LRGLDKFLPVFVDHAFASILAVAHDRQATAPEVLK
jgi:hypothetical protein